MTDAMKPDEFRQRFAQAMLNDSHLANTLEVLEIGGRPAAMQEWLTGLRRPIGRRSPPLRESAIAF